MSEEIWKIIEGFPQYMVSNKGNVMSCTNKSNGKLLRVAFDGRGYPHFKLYKDGKTKQTIKGHRLVAMAFIPNPENKPQVNHKDGNRLNNNVENLEWVTNIENRDHAVSLGLKKMSLTPDMVRGVRYLLTRNINQTLIADTFNCGMNTISRIKTKKSYRDVEDSVHSA